MSNAQTYTEAEVNERVREALEEVRAKVQELFPRAKDGNEQQVDGVEVIQKINQILSQLVEEEVTDEECEKCSQLMVVKHGRYGRFLACSGYPECKTSKAISTGVTCPQCKEGYLTEKRSKRGYIFFGCHHYPDCKFATWNRPLPEPCPSCGSTYLIQKYLKIVCPDKECSYKRISEERKN